VTILIKYGGNAMGAGGDEALLAELAELRAAGHAVILVHGGGPEIDVALTRRGVTSRRVDGLRITEAESLEIVEAVLCGTANKRLVRACLQRGIPAVGISGEDGGLIRARRATSPSGEDLGFVGEITAIDPTPLQALLDAGFLPIVAPVAIAEDSAHAYNVNADTAAGAIAGALHADAYITLTNVERVLRDPADPTSAIQKLSIAEAGVFARSDGCASGMKPKILAAIEAVSAGVTRAYICSAKPGALAGALAGHATVIS
jgi:acetylglutamate kinase